MVVVCRFALLAFVVHLQCSSRLNWCGCSTRVAHVSDEPMIIDRVADDKLSGLEDECEVT